MSVDPEIHARRLPLADVRDAGLAFFDLIAGTDLPAVLPKRGLIAGTLSGRVRQASTCHEHGSLVRTPEDHLNDLFGDDLFFE